MQFYKTIIRPTLFLGDPERMHNRSIHALNWIGNRSFANRWLASMFNVDDQRLNQEYFGLKFSNPVGLAAGFDKNGQGVQAAQNLGFGYLEIGSISHGASLGNPIRPRLFRIPKDKGTIVFYGVPNDGAEKVADRLKSFDLAVPLGVNLVETNTGKAWTPEETILDIVSAAKPFIGLADYITLNLNCPNTSEGKGPFEQKKYLMALLQNLKDIPNISPTLLKVTATSDPSTINHYLESASEFDFIKGFIFNLPPGNPYQLRTSPQKLKKMKGAVSGLPTQNLMNQTIKTWYRRIDNNRWILVGSGGIFSAEDAYQKIKYGASLIQLYTGLIYEGPGLVKRINNGLIRLMESDGINHISEVIGAED